MKKIDWPQRKQAFNYTLIVLGMTLVVALFLGLLDFIFLKIFSLYLIS